ncbi:MAG: RsmB/NOP family class I SAM-dependent RNA methyltransferase [Lentisphaeria bacterium]|nr:RsmB/NOP family class I SAM-dependent RNA methyltransferase [Lentisphaeria bacterium]
MKKFQDKSASLPVQKLKTQCTNCEKALEAVFHAVFAEKKVLDRTLIAYFRTNKQLGSRDRQLISEGIYAVFRHLGIVIKLLNPDEQKILLKEGRIIRHDSLGKMIYCALLLSNCRFAAMDMWLKTEHAPRINHADSIENQGNAILNFFKITKKLTDDDFIPSLLCEKFSPSVDAKKYMELIHRRPPMWLRIQGDKQQICDEFEANQLNYTEHPLLENAICLYQPKVNLRTLETFRNGLFEVQDAASQLIGKVCAPQKNYRVLDLCAGAGGKTLQLASMMQRKGTVIACDIREYKLQELKLRARRAGFPNIQTKNYDGKELKKNYKMNFDLVLVDAPCSCSGVWRRNPDGIFTFNTDELAEITAIQSKLLDYAAEGVRHEGYLVYATCSVFAEENENIVNDFLKRHEEYRIVKFENPLKKGEICENGMFQCDMNILDSDSMFVAKLQRK